MGFFKVISKKTPPQETHPPKCDNKFCLNFNQPMKKQGKWFVCQGCGQTTQYSDEQYQDEVRQ
jgi:hypothetical protein